MHVFINIKTDVVYIGGNKLLQYLKANCVDYDGKSQV